MGLKILLTLFLVLINGFFVAAEFSLIRVRFSQLEIKAKEGSRLAGQALSVVRRLYDYLSATQLGVTIASLLLGAVGEELFTELILGLLPHLGLAINPITAHSISVAVGLIILTFLHVLFGELFPKALAIQRPEAVSLALVLPLRAFYLATIPLTWFLSKASNLLLGAFGISNVHGNEAHTSDELRLLIDQSKESGEIQDSEHELIENVFQFNDRMVKQIMVPRTKLAALEVNMSEEQLLETVFSEGYSRLPVYEGNIDNIVGVLYVKDLLPLIRQQQPVELARIMRPAYFVPETKKINRLLRQFQRKHLVMAIVSDEFGGVSGIVTIEDIMEELVGEIQDEYDNEVPVVEKISETEYRVNTSTAISDANEYLPYPLPEGDDYETVGGLLNVLYGNIPEVGDVAVLEPYEFRVLSRARRVVELVQLRVISTDTSAGTDPLES
ncbi:HlyC/CorC family transporter [Hymenobacter sp. UV11]|uniref:hemolysin family protein n=1 Tax=Hymenobacter sp. UV11 TaxID=1849735 RepID=UPI00105EBE53|nr:hemolysin family protein [Hymenobacter sp. UV11]TDN37458.1 hemolysin [Hymenobacter sp. UV11]TFZ68645.1 HlyC/CorC family transporter [Hymenobacter sp. UV11]